MATKKVRHPSDDPLGNDNERGAALGGLGGAALGAAVGSAGGPLGTVVGVIAGGLVGAGATDALESRAHGHHNTKPDKNTGHDPSDTPPPP